MLWFIVKYASGLERWCLFQGEGRKWEYFCSANFVMWNRLWFCKDQVYMKLPLTVLWWCFLSPLHIFPLCLKNLGFLITLPRQLVFKFMKSLQFFFLKIMKSLQLYFFLDGNRCLVHSVMVGLTQSHSYSCFPWNISGIMFKPLILNFKPLLNNKILELYFQIYGKKKKLESKDNDTWFTKSKS